ncbi:MAG: DUF432 domain-containing protein [Thermosphaera sp.]
MYGVVIKDILQVGKALMRVERSDNYLKYVRTIDSDTREIILDRNAVIETRPMYPLFHPSYMTSYIIVYFSKPIVVSPKSSIKLSIRLPVDLAIYAFSGDYYEMIDVIPLHTSYKFALYGPIISSVEAAGHVARYVMADPLTGDNIKPEPNYCTSTVSIFNKTQDFARVGRILLDGKPLKIFYVTGTLECYTQNIRMTITSSEHASITYEEKPCSGCDELEEPRVFRGLLMPLSTEMLWGY